MYLCGIQYYSSTRLLYTLFALFTSNTAASQHTVYVPRFVELKWYQHLFSEPVLVFSGEDNNKLHLVSRNRVLKMLLLTPHRYIRLRKLCFIRFVFVATNSCYIANVIATEGEKRFLLRYKAEKTSTLTVSTVTTRLTWLKQIDTYVYKKNQKSYTASDFINLETEKWCRCGRTKWPWQNLQFLESISTFRYLLQKVLSLYILLSLECTETDKK